MDMKNTVIERVRLWMPLNFSNFTTGLSHQALLKLYIKLDHMQTPEAEPRLSNFDDA